MARLRDTRRYRRGLSVSAVVCAAVVAGIGTASFVVHERHGTGVNAGSRGPSGPDRHSRRGPSGGSRGTQPLPGAGAYVPAYDLASDPVFPNLVDGYAIERHTSGGVTSEHLAESRDGGHSWHLTGAAFPFETGYSEVQFVSMQSGYAFGPAGLAVTHDGGKSWQDGATLGGTLQRVVPIGANVWATYTVCSGPPVPSTTCSASLAISTDSGLHWRGAGPLPLSESLTGGDILARVTPAKAYVVSYGQSGGGLALTLDSGRHWEVLPDPCAKWRVVDMAALSGGGLWMVCGGAPTLDGAASPKAVFRSFDGGHHFAMEASTGFGPAGSGTGTSGGGSNTTGPYGSIAFAGQLSQLATISPARAWIGVTGVGVLVTDDYGHIWQLATGAGAGAGATGTSGGPGVGVTFDDARHGWAIVFQVGVWRTENGTDWHLVDGHPPAG